ncbi:MAG: helix-turn-helix domain-containing protein [Winogradskyella sp.]|uniref:helix-turn-helix domain-containing protein n=1 Tax=Winogradskyella sp. TaxID=1883156 RepID=UPI0025F9142E|nr:helix-turn-helix domain-containing protein [Winogradskyella sp.]NRB60309.1 helix-turn-helix domain-containing protein [Winogradskyella sp.]
MSELKIITATEEEIDKLISESIKRAFSNFKLKTSTALTEDEILTREETSKFLKIDLSTLYHWTNKGKVKAYAVGSRRYYKKSELLESLKPLNHSEDE